ncbi:MAG TPA: DUF3788 domain-containing protein [Symbiobacteriaceae bacterium]|nr:DUF3788 domain-containing protein [Symbiobacteriaceae bacterium]
MPKLVVPEPAPTFDEIAGSIAGPARQVWEGLTAYMEQTYGARPKIEYSICAGKPGWNVKYQKSGKSLCTLYPEPASFTVLVVIGRPVIAQVGAMLHEFTAPVADVYRRCTLYNGTYWLMIPVAEPAAADDVKRLLHLKVS